MYSCGRSGHVNVARIPYRLAPCAPSRRRRPSRMPPACRWPATGTVAHINRPCRQPDRRGRHLHHRDRISSAARRSSLRSISINVQPLALRRLIAASAAPPALPAPASTPAIQLHATDAGPNSPPGVLANPVRSQKPVATSRWPANAPPAVPTSAYALSSPPSSSRK